MVLLISILNKLHGNLVKTMQDCLIKLVANSDENTENISGHCISFKYEVVGKNNLLYEKKNKLFVSSNKHYICGNLYLDHFKLKYCLLFYKCF